MSKVGVTLDTCTEFMPGAELLALVRHIEELGFESVWLTDTMGREPFVLASTLLANTSKIRVGTGIASMYGRDAMAAAQTRRTLSEMYPDRFLMGMGVSNPMANELRKAKTLPPIEKVSSYLDDMQAVSIMTAEPQAEAPVYIAAHGPKLQKIAAEKADGVLSWVMPAQHTQLTRKRIGEGPDISCHVPFVLGLDAGEARKFAREYLSVWLALPWYRKSWGAAGFSEADFENGGSDAFIDAVVGWGDTARVLNHVDGYFQAGAGRVILQPLRRTAEGEILDVFHQTDMAPDWQALDTIAGQLQVEAS